MDKQGIQREHESHYHDWVQSPHLQIQRLLIQSSTLDIGGKDKNVHATKVLTKDALGCLIMCDCKDKRSLDETLKWKQAIESNAKFKDGSNLPIFLLQNKIDLLT